MQKTALITGGTHGIVIGSRTQKRVNEAIQLLSKYDVHVTGFTFDGTDLLSVDEAISNTLSKLKIDILINNVGGGGRWGEEDILKTEWSIWERVYNKNVNTAIKFTLAVLPNMLQQEWGRVVTISSIYGKQAGGRPWYNIAKAGEIALMKNLSQNRTLIRGGVTFNTVCPGSIMIEDTGWEKEKLDSPQRFSDLMNLEYPMGHLGEPVDVANVVAFLCKSQSSFINGAVIMVDGGESSAY